jgi:PAS domain S-box-containing protein
MGDQQAGGHDPAQADGIAEDTLLLLDGIYSSAPVGFAFLDRHFRYVRVNETLATIDGYPVADHSGRTVQEVIPGLWPQVEPSFRWVLRSGESLVNLEVSGETIAAPGTVRHWATSIYAVHSQERTIGLGVLVTDITERKRAEAAALHELMRATIGALAATVEARDPYTAGHQQRVSQLSTTIATKIGLDTDTVTGIGIAAQIHDMGKIAIPAELLMHPGPLHAAEFELIKDHPRVGREIIAGISFPWPVAEMVYEHHERFDGSGYPRGLKGDEISMGARVIAVADVLEAMASHRPYRPALGLDAAMRRLEEGRGSEFDPPVVDACLDLFKTAQLQLGF